MESKTDDGASLLNDGLAAPCEWCVDDWKDDGQFIGMIYYQECGDGCCWNRRTCEMCNGTGLAANV